MCILNFRIIYQRLNISKVVNSDVMTLCVMHNQCASSQIAVLGEVNIFSFFFFSFFLFKMLVPLINLPPLAVSKYLVHS